MKLNKFALAMVAAGACMTGAAQAAEDKSLTIGITQYPSTLHPEINSMTAKSYTLGFAHRDTVGYDADWNLVCYLCEELPTLENGLAEIVDRPNAKEGESKQGIKMTVTFREGLTWGDGTPVTTEDALFWYDVVTDPAVQGNSQLTTRKKIEKINVINDRTLEVYVNETNFSYNGANTFIPDLLPRHIEQEIYKANPAEYHLNSKYVTDPTTAGLYHSPFLVSDLKQGQFVKLTNNPHWPGKKPYFEEVTLKIVSDTQALQANLLSGDVDMIPGELGLTLDQALQFKKKFGEKYNIQIVPSAIYEHLDLQLENEHLADIRVRQAIMYGLDRKLITEKLFEGHNPVATTNISQLDAIYTDQVQQYEYNPKRAKELLKEAGYELVNGVQMKDGKPLELEFMTTAGNKTRELVQQFAQGQWKKIGIKAEINNQPARVYFGTTLTQRQHKGLAMFAWVSSPENVPKTTLHSTSIPTADNGWSGQNYLGYSNPEMDRLIDAISVELNFEERKKLWAELQELYAADLPALPLYYRSSPFLLPTWLGGLEPTGHQFGSTFAAENWFRK